MLFQSELVFTPTWLCIFSVSLWIRGALGGRSRLSIFPISPHVFTRWLQMRCAGISHGPHDGSCTDFLLFCSYCHSYSGPRLDCGTIAKYLQTPRLSPRFIHLAVCQRSPWDAQQAPQIQHHETQLSCLHHPPLVTAPAFWLLWVPCASIHPVTGPNKQASPSAEMPPPPYAPPVAIACRFFPLNVFQTCVSSASRASFEPLLGVLQKYPNIAPYPVSSPSHPLNAQQPERTF